MQNRNVIRAPWFVVAIGVAALATTSCGLLSSECVDCAGPPQPIDQLTRGPAIITRAAPLQLWWLPAGTEGRLILADTADVIELELIAATPLANAFRVPNNLPIGTTGVVGDTSVIVATSGIGPLDGAPTFDAESRGIPWCASACSTLFDPQAHPKSFESPGIAIQLPSEPNGAVALDLFFDTGAAIDDFSPRIADTTPVDSGFDQGFFPALTGNTLRLPVSPGNYLVRLRNLLDGSLSDFAPVFVEAE